MHEAKRDRWSLIQALDIKDIRHIAHAGGFHEDGQLAVIPYDEHSRSPEQFKTHVLKKYEHWYTADMHLMSTPRPDALFARVVFSRHEQGLNPRRCLALDSKPPAGGYGDRSGRSPGQPVARSTRERFRLIPLRMGSQQAS
jgi:hypothetical protein